MSYNGARPTAPQAGRRAVAAPAEPVSVAESRQWRSLKGADCRTVRTL